MAPFPHSNLRLDGEEGWGHADQRRVWVSVCLCLFTWLFSLKDLSYGLTCGCPCGLPLWPLPTALPMGFVKASAKGALMDSLWHRPVVSQHSSVLLPR